MATTLNIPLTTLPVGSQTFGPSNAKDTEAQITLTIDRTVAGGLNSLTASSVISMDLQQSNDGGTTWLDRGANGTQGGIYTIKSQQVNVWAGTWDLLPGTSRQVRATVTVSGTAIAVAGTLVTQ